MRLDRLRRRLRALNGEGWREAWSQSSGGDRSHETVKMMRLAVRVGRAEHARAMVEGDAGRAVLMETDADGESCLLLEGQ